MTEEFQNAQDMFGDDELDESMAEVELRPHILENEALLTELDEERRLQIWNPKLQSEDQLVQEYICLLKATKFLPVPPTPEELAAVHTIPIQLKTDKVTQVKVINFLSAYLTNTYHTGNVKSACDRKLPLFIPKGKFTVPNYSHLPVSYFEEIKRIKETFALAIQLESIIAVQFTNELFLLRAFNEIRNNLIDQAVSTDHMKYELKALFAVASKNYKKEHKGKVIDWDKRKSNVRAPLPFWRKNKDGPPTLVRNKYAEKLSKAILGETVNLTSATGHEELINFLETSLPTPTAVTSSNIGSILPSTLQQHPVPLTQQQQPPLQLPSQQQQHPAPPPPANLHLTRKSRVPAHRPEVGVNDYNKIFVVKKLTRKEHPDLMKRRGLIPPTTNQPNAA